MKMGLQCDSDARSTAYRRPKFAISQRRWQRSRSVIFANATTQSMTANTKLISVTKTSSTRGSGFRTYGTSMHTPPPRRASSFSRPTRRRVVLAALSALLGCGVHDPEPQAPQPTALAAEPVPQLVASAPPQAASVMASASSHAPANPPPADAPPTLTTCTAAIDLAIYREVTARESPSERQRVDTLLQAQRPMMVAFCNGRPKPSDLFACVQAAADNHATWRCFDGVFPAH